MSDQFIGQILAKKYRIDSLLREGELGNVYRGTHVSMDKPVTVKILAPALAVDENIVRQFSAEAKTASHISHANILNVTDFGSDTNNRTYLVFEGAEGKTLKETIFEQGKFVAERAVNITRQIAAALSAASAAGVVHGNLNSDNILLVHTPDNAEIVKVMDFGAVNLNEEEPSARDVEYLSPEQYTEAEGDERSNIYSLGIILYEMLAGEVPFSGLNPTDVMLKHSEEPPPPLSAFRHDLPGELEPVVLRAMAKNPEMRFQTAREFSAALSLVPVNQAGFVANNQAVSVTAGSPNNIWKTAFIVLAGISLMAVGLIYATSVKQTNPPTTLQTDANGFPVQPINPATGVDEQNLSNMTAISPEMMSNSNMAPMSAPPGTLPGGDGINPWAGGGPPPGAPPPYIPPGGQYVQVDPNNPNSPFMPVEGNNGGIILVPVPANTSVNANVKPSPTPKGTKSPVPANTAPTPVTTETPKTNPTPAPDVKATPAPKPDKTPAKPAAPKNNSPAATEKRMPSGKQQDS